ncbi:tRNA threonylcarbamoyl adenosine modification protein YeaZ [Weissella uvarum]|uniref:tRNA (adenosine(37)-N6)-threonylcarbamoyltransferase complex dimerization subunit type 1 TsaB n=1 Tax=Weissella uvarum TaxID=1479233 RepID=UPI00196127E6|nr:tRNA (adenosine(37)-N6)-threonylcarbamoyltransferase complex dimerization subunit type 1 TsaB [Weissella uvarum]MBM7616788.1 tRNA threonylcarbamoyl adenosine modification protein YeaZ [Weissella uvarum]MCM0594758.1 tRNA (adenosine(37)-N6)-threonylcarbamoyltransferase complex dimerization subunit type 1 TsaB [Weissella uvarum]
MVERTIAFDTSNQALSVAIFEDEQLLAQREANVARNHSTQLMPFIDELVQGVGWRPQDLTRVVVSQGPGSYTGLRIGVTTAKTLAFTLKIALAGVSSLALLASNADQTEALIVPMMDARNHNIYAGAYQWRQGHLENVLADAHTNVAALLEQLGQVQNAIVFAGEYAPFKTDILDAFPDARFVTDTLPHAAHLPNLVDPKQVLTNMDDIHRFVPNYHRLSQAEADWAKANPDAGTTDYVEKI